LIQRLVARAQLPQEVLLATQLLRWPIWLDFVLLQDLRLDSLASLLDELLPLLLDGEGAEVLAHGLTLL